MTDKHKMILKEYRKQIDQALDENQEETNEVYTELLEESERASVLVGASWLEGCLSDLIRLTLPDDKKVADYFLKRVRPVSVRINAAYKLGLISKIERDRLKVIMEIRNKFAHHVKVTFDDTKIAKLIAKLEPFFIRSDKPPLELPSPNDPQERYAFLVSLLYFFIVGRIGIARKESEVASRLEKLRDISEVIEEEIK